MMVNKMLDEIKNKIQNDKEVLSVLPQNNLRNRKKYYEKVNSLIDEYQLIFQKIIDEINVRYNKLCDISEDEIIDDSSRLLSDFHYFNIFESPMEILGLDKMIYIINTYENQNLDIINDNIKKIIQLFKNVGINVSGESFYLNFYASQYIDYLLNETENDKIHEFFEKIYWKCPNILKYIVVNFYDLYFQNSKKFDAYINRIKESKFSKYSENNDKRKVCFFKKHIVNTFDNFKNEYQNKILNYDNMINKSKKRYFDLFLNKVFEIKDFDSSKIDKMISDYTEDTIVVDKKSLFINLKYSLMEYQIINKYRYLIDECHELYNNKNDYKNIIKNKFKDINKITSEIKKNNNKVLKLLSKNSDSDCSEFNNKADLLLNDLLNLYNEYDIDIIKERIYNHINDNSNLSLYLELAVSSYLFLKRISDKNQIDMDASDIMKDINKLIYSPYVTLINNEKYSDLEKLNSIVVDKYKLMGFNINLDYLENGNIDNFIRVVDNIVYYYYMSDININFDDINFVLKAKEILEEK